MEHNAQTIRYPATANLMIDSDDRNFQSGILFETSPWNFQLSRSQNLQTGFFTRVSLTELVLDWKLPNLSSKYNNDTFVYDISASDISGAFNFKLPTGFYTAKKGIDCAVSSMNTVVGSNIFSVIQDCSGVGIEIAGPRQYRVFNEIPLPLQLGFPVNTGTPALTTPYAKSFYLTPDMRTFKYIDFISDNLTYCQNVKDANTTPTVKNVLQRYYFSWDDQNNLDEYGFPIYQGYTPFVSRKVYNPPKQINFKPNLPVGNLNFQVYGRFSPYWYATGPLVQGYGLLQQVAPTPDASSWMMSLQLTEN